MIDRNLILLSLGDTGIEVSRLDRYMYIFQKIGFKLNYKYKLGVHGVKSRVFAKYLEDTLAEGLIESVGGMVYTTSVGDLNYENTLITFDEYNKLHKTKVKLDELSLSELDLLLVVDLLLSDIQSTRGVQALVDERESIEKTAERLCNAYSPQNFNKMIKFITDLERI